MPDLQIVPTFPNFETFLAITSDSCRADLTAVYRRQIIAPVWESVVAGGEIAERGEPPFAMSFDDLVITGLISRLKRYLAGADLVTASFHDTG